MSKCEGGNVKERQELRGLGVWAFFLAFCHLFIPSIISSMLYANKH